LLEMHKRKHNERDISFLSFLITDGILMKLDAGRSTPRIVRELFFLFCISPI